MEDCLASRLDLLSAWIDRRLFRGWISPWQKMTRRSIPLQFRPSSRLLSSSFRFLAMIFLSSLSGIRSSGRRCFCHAFHTIHHQRTSPPRNLIPYVSQNRRTVHRPSFTKLRYIHSNAQAIASSSWMDEEDEADEDEIIWEEGKSSSSSSSLQQQRGDFGFVSDKGFRVTSRFEPTGDQPEAIAQLLEQLSHNPSAVLKGANHSSMQTSKANLSSSHTTCCSWMYFSRNHGDWKDLCHGPRHCRPTKADLGILPQ